ncbi:GNAT family N-acetyltransferase [Philodulcilactobacillus myokoensis]|uniref:GNAT family N-acetyltransferase n=1 Tax=Philodulcilactobacillus myokoensis TaxID=2929573 RepID=UPI0035A24FFD
MYLDQKFQHEGIGQKTIVFVEKQAPKLKITTILAVVFGHNQPSQKLFLRNHFERWGHLPEVAVLGGKLRDVDILGKKV